MSRSRIISGIVLCLYVAAVAYLCFAKPDDLPQMPQLWFGLPADKVGHFMMFVPFPPLAFQVFGDMRLSRIRCLVVLAIIMATGAGLAIGTEQIQALLAYRTAEMKDFCADAAGLGFGGLCTAAYFIYRKNRCEKE